MTRTRKVLDQLRSITWMGQIATIRCSNGSSMTSSVRTSSSYPNVECTSYVWRKNFFLVQTIRVCLLCRINDECTCTHMQLHSLSVFTFPCSRSESLFVSWVTHPNWKRRNVKRETQSLWSIAWHASCVRINLIVVDAWRKKFIDDAIRLIKANLTRR